MAVTISTGRRQYDTRSDRIDPNVMPTIVLRDRNLQQGNFLTFYSRTRTRTTTTEKIQWDIDTFMPTNDTTSASVTSAATQIAVSNIARYVAGQVWTDKQTGEIFRVESVNAGTGFIGVTRAITALASGGGTAAASMASGDTLVRLMPVVSEDNRRQTTQTTVPDEIFNYSQQFRYDMELSARQIKRAFLSGDSEWTYQLDKMMLQARKDLNGGFLANERGRYNDSSGGDTTITRGMMNVPTTNVLAVNGTLYQQAFDAWLMDNGLRYGSRNKVLMASTHVIGAFKEMYDQLAFYEVNMGDKTSTMGIRVLSYSSPNGGEIMIVEDRFLSDNYQGNAVLVDFAVVERCLFSNHGISGELQLIGDTQDVDDMGRAVTLIGDMGLVWGDEIVHGKITGVTGGAKGRSVQ